MAAQYHSVIFLDNKLYFTGTSPTAEGILHVRAPADGALLWGLDVSDEFNDCLGGAKASGASVYKPLRLCTDGSFLYLAGTTSTGVPARSIVVQKRWPNNGAQVWSVTIAPTNDQNCGVDICESGNYLYLAAYIDRGATDQQWYVAKLRKGDGGIEWAQARFSGSATLVRPFEIFTDGVRVYGMGYIDGNRGVLEARLASNGSVAWELLAAINHYYIGSGLSSGGFIYALRSDETVSPAVVYVVKVVASSGAAAGGWPTPVFSVTAPYTRCNLGGDVVIAGGRVYAYSTDHNTASDRRNHIQAIRESDAFKLWDHYPTPATASERSSQLIEEAGALYAAAIGNSDQAFAYKVTVV